MKAIATALNLPISVPEAGDFGAAFGAARLGMMAETSDLSIATPPSVERTIEPELSLVEAFADCHQRYKQAAHFLKDFR